MEKKETYFGVATKTKYKKIKTRATLEEFFVHDLNCINEFRLEYKKNNLSS